ncbi:hypothetical protein [Octadecabacter arcticus]|uniref:hypothetical protein n=1 Tax=Octadecabacter arcticus TaxID=53946 RepID=UPI0005C4CA5D|nr:hypothetical protein [Octadecabacter arcticus]
MNISATPLYVKTLTQDRHTVTAPRQGLYEITGDILSWIETQAAITGLLRLKFQMQHSEPFGHRML